MLAIEKESGKEEYKLDNIRATDGFSTLLAEFLDIVVRKSSAQGENKKMRSLIGLPDTSFNNFWTTIFADGHAQFFEKIMQV